MKYVNDAFTVDEENESEEQESPPSYSPQPREGEHIGPGFPPVCNCSRSEGREGEGEEGREGRAWRVQLASPTTLQMSTSQIYQRIHHPMQNRYWHWNPLIKDIISDCIKVNILRSFSSLRLFCIRWSLVPHLCTRTLYNEANIRSNVLSQASK